MFYIEDNVIYITKGDYGSIMLDLYDGEGVPYVMQEGDEVELTVRAQPTSTSEVVLSSTSTGPLIEIQPEDTASAATGEYSADIQLSLADGKIFTFWPRLEGDARIKNRNFKNFVIMPEVTNP